MSRTRFAQLLMERAESAGLTLDTRLSAGLEAYFEVLRRWNRRINLTGLDLDVLTPEGVDRLFIEPLIASRHVAPGSQSIIDLGSGGGSPALPLALATRASALTMVESRSRKSVFLREAARELGVLATVLTMRWEEALERDEMAGAFDTLSCRALRLKSADLARVERFVRLSGRVLLFRSVADETDLRISPPLVQLDSRPLPRPDSELLVLSKTG